MQLEMGYWREGEALQRVTKFLPSKNIVAKRYHSTVKEDGCVYVRIFVDFLFTIKYDYAKHF